jgi:antitoxin VapB
MERVNLFKNNTSQAVRLPKGVAYPDSVRQVDIVIQGRARIITPAGESWDSWFESEGVSDDFMDGRDQPEHQKREEF